MEDDHNSALLPPSREHWVPRRLADKNGPPFKLGATIADPDFQAEVVELTQDGRPAAVRFRFPRPLPDPSLRLMYVVPDHFLPFKLPAVGGEVVIPGLLEIK